MIEFEKIENADDMDEYLESSANIIDDDNPVIYSHYTDIKSALSIFSTKSIWLSSYGRMNDLFEKEILDKSSKKGNFYFISLSRANESLAMYRMYGKKESSVVLRIPASFFVGSIREHLDSEFKGGVDDDSRSGSYVRNVDVIDYDRNVSTNIPAILSLEDVVYFDPSDNTLSIDGHTNVMIISPLKENSLVGHVKYKCWDYERETRFCAQILDDMKKPIDKVSVNVPANICNEIQVILGPGFNKEKYYDELVELRRLGVRYWNSAYDGFFRDTNHAKRFAAMQYYKDYDAKIFSGSDPWGGVLFIQIIHCDAEKLVIEWTNEFEDDGVNRIISKRLEMDMTDDLICQYDIYSKQPISGNENEYLSYTYSGTIQLIDGKMLVSFNSGEYYKYSFGASGSRTYSEGGSWRMGTNLLAILEEEITKE